MLIRLCLWSVFVMVVGCPKPLLWAVVISCGGGVGFFCWLSLGFFVAGFVGSLNFGCFYAGVWLVFEMILLQI